MVVIKRDGREVPFDKQKIIDAISKAMRQVGIADLSSASIEADEVEIDLMEAVNYDDNAKISVEAIQNTVENVLMASAMDNSVAKEYIKYRYLHKLARDQYSDLMSAVEEKLTAKNVQNQNANVDEHSFGGRIGEAASLVDKKYALDYLVSPMAKKNHEENMIYIHDLDHYAVGSHNCLSIPFDKLLANGFNTRQTDVRPAQSISTAFQLVAVIFQIQSLQQFGGVSATHLDWTMVPYVRKSFQKHYKDGLKYCTEEEIPSFLLGYSTGSLSLDNLDAYPLGKARDYALDMTKKELNQAVEGMYHNLK